MSKKIISDFNQDAYPRDLKGYADKPPKANWPGGAKIAVQFVLNIEEGAENSGMSWVRQSLTIVISRLSRHLSMVAVWVFGEY